MILLRVAILLPWVAVMIWGGLSLVWIKLDPQPGDPMRIACFLVAVPVVGLNLWWVTGWASPMAYAILLLMLLCAGFYTLFAMWSYGRRGSR